ncbi:hypothetical protein HanRHA438_Chr12g0539261 [Helianthus annuus]|nr:hypothetical protein HanRHA438_Chr12g0539261 [Helianthus annuus]
MKRKVSRLSESFNAIKDVNLQLTAFIARELIEDPLKYVGSSKRWKITSNYGDIGFKYRDDQTIAYVASRMPAVFSACYRVLTEENTQSFKSLPSLLCSGRRLRFHTLKQGFEIVCCPSHEYYWELAERDSTDYVKPASMGHGSCSIMAIALTNGVWLPYRVWLPYHDSPGLAISLAVVT